MRGSGICPSISERAEARPGLADCIEDIQQVARGARKPIKPRYQKDIPRTKLSNCFRQCLSLGHCATNLLCEYSAIDPGLLYVVATAFVADLEDLRRRRQI